MSQHRPYNADQVLSDADQVSANTDQMQSNTGRDASESDQVSADADQAASDEDQADADRTYQAIDEPTADEVRQYNTARYGRIARSVKRWRSSVARLAARGKREAVTKERGQTADDRDARGRARDGR